MSVFSPVCRLLSGVCGLMYLPNAIVLAVLPRLNIKMYGRWHWLQVKTAKEVQRSPSNPRKCWCAWCGREVSRWKVSTDRRGRKWQHDRWIERHHLLPHPLSPALLICNECHEPHQRWRGVFHHPWLWRSGLGNHPLLILVAYVRYGWLRRSVGRSSDSKVRLKPVATLRAEPRRSRFRR